MENKKIIAYKGFGKDMKCRNFQYEEGKEYETNEVKCCERGFHACENPIDILKYYDPAGSVYHIVECSGDIDGNDDDSKFACTNIKIGREISIEQICKATFDYVKSKCTNEHNANNGEPVTAGYKGAATVGDRGAATAGDRGAATAGDKGAATAGESGAATAGNDGAATAGNCGVATVGDRGAATAGNDGAATAGYRGAAKAGHKGAATAGNYGVATAGDRGAATAGYKGAATAGESGAATAGYWGAATAGDKGAATAGESGAATAGDCGVATSRGKSAVGEKGLAVVRGNCVKVKGGLGAILVIAEENTNDYNVKEWKAVVVDGQNVKANTWYTLEEGELVECT